MTRIRVFVALALGACCFASTVSIAGAQSLPGRPTGPIAGAPGGAESDPDELLLPDVIVDPGQSDDWTLTRNCDGLDGVELCVRVSIGTANIGEGDLLLTAPMDHKDQVSEHIARRGGGETLEMVDSAFVDDPRHQHLHLADWTELRLRKIDQSCDSEDTAMSCPIAGLGRKLSFCLTDNVEYDRRLGPLKDALGPVLDAYPEPPEAFAQR